MGNDLDSADRPVNRVRYAHIPYNTPAEQGKLSYDLGRDNDVINCLCGEIRIVLEDYQYT